MIQCSKLSNSINNIPEKDWRIINYDYVTSTTDLLAKRYSLTIHHKKSQKLVTEMLKVKIGITAEIMREFF